MKNPATQLLTALAESGELSLERIAKLVPCRFSDHRDFYVLASLVTQGLIDDPFLPNSDAEPVGAKKIQLLSRKYFAMSTAEKKASYENHTWLIAGGEETLKGQVFALSGAGYLHLAEARTKRVDRAFTIGAGILIGIMVALCSVLIQRYTRA